MHYFKIIIFIIAFLSSSLYACGTCYGDPNSAAVEGMNWAIISLLITTGGVMSGISFSIFSIAKKSKNYNKSKEF